MRLTKTRIKNFKSIKDSGDIFFIDGLYILAGQNESGKSSILEAIEAFEYGEPQKDNLNFQLENEENYLQEIACTFSDISEDDKESFYEVIVDYIKELHLIDQELDDKTLVSEDLKKKIDEFTITRLYDYTKEEVHTGFILDNNTLGKIKGSVKTYDEKVEGENGSESFRKIPYLDMEIHAEELAEIIFQITPHIIHFNDFSTLLPDRILLDDIDKNQTAGYEAVKNLEKLISKPFNTIAQKEVRKRKSSSEDESRMVSANFQDDWQQKIYGNNKVNITFDILNNEQGQKEIVFSVLTKDNEFLAPRRRSKGMIWFLSLWLELKAKENGNKLILLFDEPGLHLHIKANKNMLNVFHKLVDKGHQIIYSTHSPSLIETDNLHKIGLVINDIHKGTTVEGLTSSRLNSDNKREALQPIAEAMGLEPLKDFSVFNQKNVLLEGLSDFWILKGFEKLLEKKLDYSFIPGVGIKGNKINPLISFCIGYGFDWLLIMDGGENPKILRDTLKEDLFGGDEAKVNNKVYLFAETEVENIFDVSDLSVIDANLKPDINKKPIEIIGKKRKIIFSKMFYQKVSNGSLKKSHLKQSTLKSFEKVFNWIDSRFNEKDDIESLNTNNQ